MTITNFNKLEEIRQALNSKFFERENEIEGILVALLSRQHMLMIGPAGTAKSALSGELAKIVARNGILSVVADKVQYSRRSIWSIVVKRP